MVRKINKVILATVVAAAISLGFAVPASAATTDEQTAMGIVFKKTNEYRAAKGLAPLKYYSSVATVSQKWADNMNSKNKLYHNPNFFSQMPQSGLRSGAENVGYACGYEPEKAAEVLMKALKDSPGHYKNMVNANYTNIGIGFTYNSKTKCAWVVQNFGDYKGRSSIPNSRYPIANNGPYIDVNKAANSKQIGYNSLSSHIIWAYDQNITRGYKVTDGKEFRASNKMDRGATAAFLYRAFGKDDPVDMSVLKRYSDVNKDSKFAKEIAWMTQYGISTGYSDGTFRSSRAVKRSDMSAFLYRVAKHEGVNISSGSNKTVLSKYSDVSKSSSQATAVSWMINEGISKPSGSKFGYGDTVSRAAAVTFIHRLYNKM